MAFERVIFGELLALVQQDFSVHLYQMFQKSQFRKSWFASVEYWGVEFETWSLKQRVLVIRIYDLHQAEHLYLFQIVDICQMSYREFQLHWCLVHVHEHQCFDLLVWQILVDHRNRDSLELVRLGTFLKHHFEQVCYALCHQHLDLGFELYFQPLLFQCEMYGDHLDQQILLCDQLDGMMNVLVHVVRHFQLVKQAYHDWCSYSL